MKKQQKQKKRTVWGASVGRWSWEGDWRTTAAAAQAVSPRVATGFDIIAYTIGAIEIVIRKRGDGGVAEVYIYEGSPWLPVDLVAYLSVMRQHGLTWSDATFTLSDGGKCWLKASSMGVELVDAP